MSESVEMLLFKELRPFFERYDFYLLLPKKQFRKQTKLGFHNVIISVSGSKPCLIEVNIGVRLDLVEELAYQFTTGLSGYQRDSNTLVTSLGRIIGDPYKRFEAEDHVSVKKAARDIADLMVSEGFYFQEKYDSIKALDQLVNKEPTKKNPFIYNNLHRCLRGVVIARLAENKNFNSLVATYRRSLVRSSTAPPLLERYDKLVNYLKSFSVN
ncbi:MAG: hypothetical protein ACLFUB_10150 [Cyclobacteriaceae bacterium]